MSAKIKNVELELPDGLDFNEKEHTIIRNGVEYRPIYKPIELFCAIADNETLIGGIEIKVNYESGYSRKIGKEVYWVRKDYKA